MRQFISVRMKIHFKIQTISIKTKSYFKISAIKSAPVGFQPLWCFQNYFHNG